MRNIRFQLSSLKIEREYGYIKSKLKILVVKYLLMINDKDKNKQDKHCSR